jgi:hypothetical protein
MFILFSQHTILVREQHICIGERRKSGVDQHHSLFDFKFKFSSFYFFPAAKINNTKCRISS